MGKREEILRLLRSLRSELQKRFKVYRLALFGSAARDEMKDSSDIDLLVDFDESADFFDMVALGEFLEEKLKRKVDITTSRALRQEFKEAVARELVTI